MRNRFTTTTGRLAVLLPLLLFLAPEVAHAVNPNANEEQKKHKVVVQKTRYWSADTLFETHFTVVRDNETSNDVYHMLYLRGNYDMPRMGYLPALGRLSLLLSLQRKYVADPGESGFLFGDIYLYWSKQFRFSLLGQDFGVRPYFYWTFPTSKESKMQSNVARPLWLVALSKALPHNLHLFVRPYWRVYWHRYSTREGGAPNRKALLGYDIQLLYTFHLHKRLHFGATWGQEFYTFYKGIEGYDQPWQQEYLWEVFTGYDLVKDPVRFSVYLTLASGRPVYEDGVPKFHAFDRDETELYLTLNASY